MSSHGRCLRLAARSKSSQQTSLALCLLVFTLTGAIVYWRGVQNWVSVGLLPTYTATVSLFQQAANPADREAAASLSDSQTRVAFTQTEATAEQAIQQVKAQAARYASRHREEWSARTEEPYLKAKQAAENASKAHAETMAQLVAFSRRLDEARQTAAKTKVQVKPVAIEPRMVDNPRWQALQNQLVALQREDEQLRTQRTPLHPAVQEMAARIAGVEKQLAAIPPRIPARHAETAEAINQEAARQGSSVPAVENNEQETAANTPMSLAPIDGKGVHESVSALRAIAAAPQDEDRWIELVAAVDRTRRDCNEAELAEKAALLAKQAGPTFALDEVQVVENVPPVDYGWRRLIATTLGTSLMMAIGFGAFTKGAEIEPTLASAAQLEADLNIPILGVVPATDPIDSTAKYDRQSRNRKTLIALGLFLMCVCPLAAIWGIVGM